MHNETRFYVAAHGLIKNHSEKYLTVFRSHHNNYMPQLWDLPGGTVEAGETPERALIREILEETAISVRVGNLLHAYSNMDGLPTRQTIQLVYSCTYLSGDVQVNPAEHDEFRWETIEGLSKLEKIAYFDDLLTCTFTK